MARFRLRPPAWIVGGKGGMSVSGNLQYLGGTKALGAVLLGGTGRTRISGGVTAHVPPPVGDTWTVPPQTFIVGSGTTYDMKPTVPASFTDGGVFDVDSSGTQLPAGMTLTNDGVLGVGTTAASVTSGVKFGYTEPNALPVITLYPSVTGTMPYTATAYPCEGAVPSGRFLVSPDDPNLRSSTLSTWPDGSAQVMVVASSGIVVDNGVQKTINLRLNKSTDSAGTALTTAAVTAAMGTGITVNFSGTPQSLATFTTPDWIWWANSQVICARYRLSCGMGVMEAVIDIHAFAGGKAIVEIVVENSKWDCNGVNTTPPVPQIYTNATLAVNGTTFRTVSSPIMNQNWPNALSVSYWRVDGHEGLRAFYVAAQVDGATVTDVTSSGAWFGIEPTHDTASMWAHPIFYKPIEVPSENMVTKYNKTYDTYIPWAICRQRVPGMAGAGGTQSAQLGMYTGAQSDYITTASRDARRALLANDLAALVLNHNYRHDGTGGAPGTIPTVQQMTWAATGYAKLSGERGASGTYRWPWITNEPRLDQTGAAHVAPGSVVAFMCRPSPCFIELAQKMTTRHSVFNKGWPLAPFFEEVRGRAWGMRDHANTYFLTPAANYDGTNRKAGYLGGMEANITVLEQFSNKTWNHLGVLVGNGGDTLSEVGYSGKDPGQEESFSDFMNSYTVQAFSMVERMKYFSDSAETRWKAFCDWHCTWPIRFVNTAPSGEWRVLVYYPQQGIVADNAGNINQFATFAEAQHTLTYTDVENTPSEQGFWLVDPKIYNPATGTFSWSGGEWDEWSPSYARLPEADFRNYTNPWTGWASGNDANYDAWFWGAFATAVERGGTDADAAWSRVLSGITNFSIWRTGFRTFPCPNRWPRNK